MTLVDNLPTEISNMLNEYIFDETPTNRDIALKKDLLKVIEYIDMDRHIKYEFIDSNRYYTEPHIPGTLRRELVHSESRAHFDKGYNDIDTIMKKNRKWNLNDYFKFYIPQYIRYF